MTIEQDSALFLEWLKTEIPLLNHMGIKKLDFDGESLAMAAALSPNVNDKGTGFGGSLATFATISGWSLTTLLLRERGLDCDVMIRDCQLNFQAPVTDDFIAKVSLPSELEVEGFLDRLVEKGKARLGLNIAILQSEQSKLLMTGNYVAVTRT